MVHAEPILHGGDLDTARGAFPDAPEPWFDLSTGINPRPFPLPPIADALWARLPQTRDEQALRAAAARRYGAGHPDMVVPAPGTQALIQILPRLIGPSQVAIVSPTYAEHAAAWRREGHQVAAVPDIEAAEAARVVVLVNPNNPTGRLESVTRLTTLAGTVHARAGLLVVDEAFADLLPAGASLVPGLPPGTVVLRSFGKAYGLAGLRLGFAIAHRDMASRLRAALGPWAVAGPGLAVGTAALADERWLEDTRDRLEGDVRRLDALLTEHGCDIAGGTPLFRLARHPDASRLADTLGRHGLHVRRFPDMPTWLRFGLPGSDAAWHRLTLALRRAGGG